jgi:signal transduction histidine kinase
MGEVLRQDLDAGKLLALEEDIPELRRAADEASTQIRTLIRNLRRASLGVGGLSSTLQLLINDLAARTSAKIEAEIQDIPATPSQQLLIYQVAREALHNAVAHAEAGRISIRLLREEGDARLIVEDDGCGFRLHGVDRDRHFGLQLMAERADQAGALLHIESGAGVGTSVVAKFPLAEDR